MKTLYGLKQAGHRWNKKLDSRLKACGFTCLNAEFCIYMKCEKGNFQCAAIWVDDLFLFANSKEAMEEG
jgi:hypothetical protein